MNEQMVQRVGHALGKGSRKGSLGYPEYCWLILPTERAGRKVKVVQKSKKVVEFRIEQIERGWYIQECQQLVLLITCPKMIRSQWEVQILKKAFQCRNTANVKITYCCKKPRNSATKTILTCKAHLSNLWEMHAGNLFEGPHSKREQFFMHWSAWGALLRYSVH